MLTPVTSVLGLLQFIGQEPHHATGVDVALVDVREPVRTMVMREMNGRKDQIAISKIMTTI